MKKIKIYIQYPWKISDSQYYKSMINTPPEGIEYIYPAKRQGMITNKKKLYFVNFFRQTCREFIEKSKLPILNSKFTSLNEKVDLIHCAHCLSENKNIPWVADFEALWQMWISGRDTKLGRQRALKLLKNRNCKKIIAWTEETKRNIIEKFPEVKNKIEVIPYGQPVEKFKKINKNKIRILFMGRYFYEKGGLHAVEAIHRLTQKYENVEGKIISKIPDEVLEKYSTNKKIIFSELIPHEKVVKEILPSTDILIYPGYTDTFGFAFTEAMVFRVPIITVDGFARKELVEDGKTGFVIDVPKELEKVYDLNFYGIGKNEEEVITKMVEKASCLIEDKKLLKKMSLNGEEIVKEGKFSIKDRNKKLLKAYKEALV